MIVNNLLVKNFRNIESINFNPCENVNIIHGENAQGKTNIIEAMYLFTGMKSFRTTNISDFINFNESFADLEIKFFSEGREQNAKLHLDGKKTATLNEIKLKSPTKLDSHFPAVLFTPEHLSLVKGGPEQRRKYIDTILCHISESYQKYLLEYYKILKQRNAFLKNEIDYSRRLENMADWNEILINRLAVVSKQRHQLVKSISPIASEYYLGMSKDSTGFSVDVDYSYNINFNNEEALIETIQNYYRIALNNSADTDARLKTTTVGAHRDDMSIKIDNISAKSFGSQGQQRSCAIALKLAEAKLIEEKTGEKPIILLDDIMSELDVNRQSYIMNCIKEWQVFITCCDPSTILRLKDGKTFQIKNGEIV